ncbi:hypothetical protein D3C87_1174080 [compost metagenome]
MSSITWMITSIFLESAEIWRMEEIKLPISASPSFAAPEESSDRFDAALELSELRLTIEVSSSNEATVSSSDAAACVEELERA